MNSGSRLSGRFLSVMVSVALLSACTEPREITGIGAATGGALGAGLGAIVGNQTGDAGSGLVIGALAGAGAGAAVGNALQAQDEAVRSQDEAIERQDQIIRAQRGEIEELRQMSQDSVRFRSKSSYPSAPPAPQRYSYAREPLRVPLRAPSSVSSLPQQQVRPPLTAPPVQFRSGNLPAQLPVKRDLSLNETDIRPEIPVLRASQDVAPVEPVRAATEPVAAEFSESLPNESIDDVVAPGAAVENAPAVAQAAAAVSQPRVALDSSDCKQAETEFTQAQSMNEPPERLFHIRRALRLCPDVATYHVGLGDVYLSLGRRDDAKYEYSEALRLNPEASDIRAKLQGVEKDTY